MIVVTVVLVVSVIFAVPVVNITSENSNGYVHTVLFSDVPFRLIFNISLENYTHMAVSEILQSMYIL